MAVRINSGVVAVNSPITNSGGPNNASLGLDQTALNIIASQVDGTAVTRADSLFILNGADVYFGGTVTTSGGSALVVASPITITGGTIGLDQPAISITKSQVADFTSGTVAYSTTSGTAVYSTLSGTASTISGNISSSQVTGTAVIRSDNLLTVNGTAIPFGGTVVTAAGFITAVASPITNTGGTAGLDQTALSIQPSQVVGTAVITTDARLSDARTPTAHATSHESGGADEIEIAPAQVTGTAVITSDSRLGAIKTGGTAGQVLAKASATDYDTSWVTPNYVSQTNGVVTTAATDSTVVRNITLSTAAPSGGADGDVWLVYEA